MSQKTKTKKKITTKKEPKKKAEKKVVKKYIEGIGRRKTSTARVRIFPEKKEKKQEILINSKSLEDYFPTLELQKIVLSPLEKIKCLGRFSVLAKVKGGGIHSQAEAVLHGLARALVKFNPEFRKRLKRAGFLTRDPRVRERKKFGLKRARRAPQWQKR
jgi:small subunit ribosomal protein S9